MRQQITSDLARLASQMNSTETTVKKRVLDAEAVAVRKELDRLSAQLKDLEKSITAQRETHTRRINEGAEQIAKQIAKQIKQDQALIPQRTQNKDKLEALQEKIASAQKMVGDVFEKEYSAIQRELQKEEFKVVKNTQAIRNAQNVLEGVNSLANLVRSQEKLHHYRYAGWGETASKVPIAGPSLEETKALLEALSALTPSQEAITQAIKTLKNTPNVSLNADEKKMQRINRGSLLLVPVILITTAALIVKFSKGDAVALTIGMVVAGLVCLALLGLALNYSTKVHPRKSAVSNINCYRKAATNAASLYRPADEAKGGGASTPTASAATNDPGEQVAEHGM